MPELSRFFGIVIGMFYREHGAAHFHAVYRDEEISVEIETGLFTGTSRPRALKRVVEWRDLRKAELLEDWQFANQGKPLKPIAPLE